MLLYRQITNNLVLGHYRLATIFCSAQTYVLHWQIIGLTVCLFRNQRFAADSIGTDKQPQTMHGTKQTNKSFSYQQTDTRDLHIELHLKNEHHPNTFDGKGATI